MQPYRWTYLVLMLSSVKSNAAGMLSGQLLKFVLETVTFLLKKLDQFSKRIETEKYDSIRVNRFSYD